MYYLDTICLLGYGTHHIVYIFLNMYVCTSIISNRFSGIRIMLWPSATSIRSMLYQEYTVIFIVICAVLGNRFYTRTEYWGLSTKKIKLKNILEQLYYSKFLLTQELL